MNNLKHWKNKIIEKRKDTDFMTFLLEIGSWTSVAFHKNNGLISRYPETERINLVHFKEFDKQRDDYINNGLDYDFSKNFFKNFTQLFRKTPLPNLFHVGDNENCDYVDTAVYAKNSYLSSLITIESENVFYSFMVRENSVNIFNSFYVVSSNNNVFTCLGIFNSYNIFYSKYIKNSNNIWFSTNLTGCSECLFCDELENSKYYIKNKKYSKEEYFSKKGLILKDKYKFNDYYSKLNNKGNNYSSSESSGNFVIDCENVKNGFGVMNMTDSRNIMFSGSRETGNKCYDLIFGGKGTNDCYGVSNFGGNPSNIFLSYNVGYGNNIFYSYGVTGCSYMIGCIGLQNKQYCIFNKQYTKKEWEVLSDKIFTHMENDGILGEYFPGSMNPLYFNDTFASFFGNFKREEVEKKGYMWREEEVNIDIPEGVETISYKDLGNFEGYNSEGVWIIDDDIMNKTIEDKNGRYYKIVKDELNFLKKYSLPLPEIHWMDRIKNNLGV